MLNDLFKNDVLVGNMVILDSGLYRNLTPDDDIRYKKFPDIGVYIGDGKISYKGIIIDDAIEDFKDII